tara:strand:+ start:23511 stop:24497 length:987 start_codon:yes stop_codon:yes gene_type:complete
MAAIGRRNTRKDERKQVLSQASAMMKRDIALCTGRVVTFFPKVIPSEQIREMTYVDPSVNGRNQDLLSVSNTDDLGQSLDSNQFYPGYGCKTEAVDDKYSLLDGSRRSYYCAENGVDFEGYFTDEVLTHEEQVHLASQLQTAKEHHTSEQGKKYQAAMDEHGLTQEQVAKRYGVSPSSVSRALKAMKVDVGILRLFPDLNKISHKHWDRLYTLQLQLDGHKVEVLTFCNAVEREVEDNLQVNDDGEIEDITNDLVMKCVEAVLKDEFKIKKEAPEKFKSEPLRKFNNKNRKARVKTKGSITQFELVGVSSDRVERIKEAILKEIESYD